MDSPLISPSKARRDAAQAKDWSYISRWLAKKYTPHPVPRFERNDDVLQEVLALITANETADAEAELLRRAGVDELERYETALRNAAEDLVDELLAEVEESLDVDGTKALDDLAEASVMLGTLQTDTLSLGERLTRIERERFEAEQQRRRVSDLQAYLERGTASLRKGIVTLKEQEDEGLTEELHQETTQWNRDTKQIGMKLAEYKERLMALERARVVGPSVEDVKADEKEIQVLQAQVKGLEKQIQDFHGLPPDLEVAKGEYQRSQKELHALMRRRDDLWERMMQSR